MIFSSNDYLCVSDIEEYYYDVDINIYYVDENCELIDSRGNKFNFKEIEGNQWVPDMQTGAEEFKAVKERISPLLYMPSHKEGLPSTSNFHELMELISTE